MDEELRKAIADYFDAGDFAEFIGVTTEQLIDAFEDEVEDNLDEILELMGAADDASLFNDEGE
jgi:hypothetical protein